MHVAVGAETPVDHPDYAAAERHERRLAKVRALESPHLRSSSAEA